MLLFQDFSKLVEVRQGKKRKTENTLKCLIGIKIIGRLQN